MIWDFERCIIYSLFISNIFHARVPQVDLRESFQKKNYSVLNFSALRAATLIKNYIETQNNIGRKVLNNFLRCARPFLFRKQLKTNEKQSYMNNFPRCARLRVSVRRLETTDYKSQNFEIWTESCRLQTTCLVVSRQHPAGLVVVIEIDIKMNVVLSSEPPSKPHVQFWIWNHSDLSIP